MELILARLAQTELADARRYYEALQPGLGSAFVREATLSVERIREHPLAWPVEVDPVRRLLFNRFPYKMLYAIRGERVIVLAVAHLHREPDYWIDRLST